MNDQPRPRFDLIAIAIGLCVFCMVCVGVVGFFFRNRTIAPSASPTAIYESTYIPLSTSNPSYSLTPEITPTPVPLPIREDFDKQYSDLWRRIGDPLVTESVKGGIYSGVLSTREGETASLYIGNIAWTDYVISLRANTWMSSGWTENGLAIGVRVKDPNNMIVFDCGPYYCNWVIYYEGNKDTLPTEKRVDIHDIEIIVDGNTVTAIYSNADDGRMKIEIPSKYQGAFTGGGVMLQTKSVMEVDFIEIDPLP